MNKDLKSYINEVAKSKKTISVPLKESKAKKLKVMVQEETAPTIQLINPNHKVKIEKAYGYIGKPEALAQKAYLAMAKLAQPIRYKIDDLFVQADLVNDPYTWTNQDGNVIKINYFCDLENFIPDWWDLLFRTNWDGPMPSHITSVPKVAQKEQMPEADAPEYVMYKGSKCQVVKFTRGPMVGIMQDGKVKMVKKEETKPCESKNIKESMNQEIDQLKKLSGIKNA